MFTKFAESVYNSYLAELRRGSDGRHRRKKRLRKLRRFLLKLGDPDVIASLDGFGFKTPFSSETILFHFEFPFYDSTLPRLAQAVSASRGKLVMIDVGANIGAATYLVSRRTQGRFFCIEANPRFKANLCHNLAQIPGSRARFSALTDVKNQAVVRHNYVEGNSSIEHSGAEGGELLEFITMDEALAAEPDYAAPNLVKIDTEGFELKILRGATRTLTEQRPVLFFEFFPSLIRREGSEPAALFELLQQHGYDRFMFYDNFGNHLVSVNGAGGDQIRSLSRYGELGKVFFDTAAFHSSDAGLASEFQLAENMFFEHNLHLQCKHSTRS